MSQKSAQTASHTFLTQGKEMIRTGEDYRASSRDGGKVDINGEHVKVGS